MSLPWPGGQPGSWQNYNVRGMRAADSDRERAVDVLKAAMAEGRLTKEEFDERVDAVHRAKTYGELHKLVADVPQGPMPPAQPPAPVPAVSPMSPMSPTMWPSWSSWSLPVSGTTNQSALAAMICGVLVPMTGGVTAIPAVVLGHKARAEISRTGQSGEGMATAGLVIGYLSIVCGVLFLLGLIAPFII